MSKEILETNLGDVPMMVRGKVRDVYDLGDKLLIVATDRISAYDCIMPNGIPGRGKILTEMSEFWFGKTQHIVKNHLISTEVGDFPDPLPQYADQLEGRSMLVVKADRFDVECVARGYITGSGWRDYQKTGEVCGISLPKELRESDRLEEVIFTPATKADSGHDENISFEEMLSIVDLATAEKLRDLTVGVYGFAREYAESRDIIIADTKFEFGQHEGEIILIDEILSPDSSRFWDRKHYEPGRSQDSFDKQFVRDYLDTLDWDKTPPAPALPDEIVQQTLNKYVEARDRLIERS
jgi:phosphoribosylaminoimidazole-succinocarboxamide synthase